MLNNEVTKKSIGLRKAHERFYFGMGKDDKVYAYTFEEWGLGGTVDGRGIPQQGSVVRTALLAIFMLVAAINCAYLTGVFFIGLHWEMYISFPLTLVFTAGFFLYRKYLAREYRAYELRKASGKPKAKFGVTDDWAYDWFLKNPDPNVPMTLKAFPRSVRLQYQDRLKKGGN